MDSSLVESASSIGVHCSAVLEPAVSAAALASVSPAVLATALAVALAAAMASAPVAWATEATGSAVEAVVMELMASGLTHTRLPSLDTKAS